uniref:Procathepsin L n=1 Tax=Suricata suricatta TaxID=37032 RepID=A0A673TSE0_SURSU
WVTLSLFPVVSLGLALTTAAQPRSGDNASNTLAPNKQLGSVKSSRLQSLDKTMVPSHIWIQTGGGGFDMAMNGFGDMTNEEFRHMMLGLKIQKNENKKVFNVSFPTGSSLPVVKGRQMPAVTPGRCASGWAFSAVGAIERQIFRYTGEHIPLSVQNLLDCSWAEGNEGCNGGLMSNAFQYVRNNGGLDTEESYPYVARDGPCKYRPEHSIAKITAFQTIPQREDALLAEMKKMRSISAAIDASLDSFRFYAGGIYYDPKCNSRDLNHGVLIIGHGIQGKESENKKYWVVKNSWGRDWGMNGYIKMARDRNNHCGIASMASFPIV